jgi:hypothetical protein
MRHQLVGVLEVLPGEEWSVVVISTKFPNDKQGLAKEVLAFLRYK